MGLDRLPGFRVLKENFYGIRHGDALARGLLHLLACPGYAIQQSLAGEFRLPRGQRILAHVLELLLLAFQPRHVVSVELGSVDPNPPALDQQRSRVRPARGSHRRFVIRQCMWIEVSSRLKQISTLTRKHAILQLT